MADPVTISVRVTPRAGRDEITGVGDDGSLRVRVTAAPVDGAANEAVVRLVASGLGLARRAVELAGGATSRQKRLRISGIEPATLQARWPGLSLGGMPRP
jgi:uncharacterized protein (TIGR00251 family)